MGQGVHEEFKISDKGNLVTDKDSVPALGIPIKGTVHDVIPESALSIVVGGTLVNKFVERQCATIGCAFQMATQLVCSLSRCLLILRDWEMDKMRRHSCGTLQVKRGIDLPFLANTQGFARLAELTTGDAMWPW